MRFVLCISSGTGFIGFWNSNSVGSGIEYKKGLAASVFTTPFRSGISYHLSPAAIIYFGTMTSSSLLKELGEL